MNTHTKFGMRIVHVLILRSASSLGKLAVSVEWLVSICQCVVTEITK